jgi:molecular chaperone DnaK
VAIEIFQGASEIASKNRRLGRFVLGDLRAATKAAVRVEVSFTLDADGILHVDATEVGTERQASVTIEAASGLAAGDIERLQQALRG